MDNPDGFEVLPAAGRLVGQKCKLVVVACYLPPYFPVPKGKAALSHISDCNIQAKRRYEDPLILVTGYFNRWAIGDTIRDFVDFNEVASGPTRNDRCVDRMFINFKHDIAGTVPLP